MKADNSSSDNTEKPATIAFLPFFAILLLSFFCWRHCIAGATRYPLWAGSFYPEDSAALQQNISNLTDRVTQPVTPLPREGLKALILPHAGHRYSGLTAAHASLVLHKGQFQKVILLGPDHRADLENGVISPVNHFRTPLGDIAIHPGAHTLRQKSSLFHEPLASSRSEHSLEVVLPFLQYYLGPFELTPIVLGSSEPQAISDFLAPLMGQGTLLVVSTDLSHYLPYNEATEKDLKTINHILQLQEQELVPDANMACGIFALKTLMNLARRDSWQPVLLHYSNSGDTAERKDQVVGYAAIAFFATQGSQNEEQP